MRPLLRRKQDPAKEEEKRAAWEVGLAYSVHSANSARKKRLCLTYHRTYRGRPVFLGSCALFCLAGTARGAAQAPRWVSYPGVCATKPACSNSSPCDMCHNMHAHTCSCLQEAYERRRKVKETVQERQRLRQEEKDQLAQGIMPETLKNWKPCE